MEQTMSFTDGKPFKITDKDVNEAPWAGYRDGRRLRCQLCGKFLMIGEQCRWIFANGSGYNHGNFLVCLSCDEDDDSVVIDKAIILAEEAEQKFWWLMSRSRLPSHPQAKRRDRRREEEE